MIIATAGHIDHGSQVPSKALTGIETDRLPEERAQYVDRLGFRLYRPQQRFGQRVHRRARSRTLFTNMLAGVSGIDYAILIVAADDGPMPQTEEHLAILDLLGVEAGCIALTKIDRVDPERVEEAKELIHILVDGTTMEGAEIFPVSNATLSGIPLKQHLSAIAGEVPDRTGTGSFRLAIDRCFTLSGTGLVVTGTVFSGNAKIGDRMTLTPLGREVRIRGIHAQNEEAETGGAGQRCALNIAAQGSEPGECQTRRLDRRIRSHAPTRRLMRVFEFCIANKSR